MVVLAAAILAGFWFFLARRRRNRPEPGLVPATASPYHAPRPALPTAAIKPPKPDKVKKPKAPRVETASPVFTPSPTFADAIPAAPSSAMAEPYGEANMPRWRRPSLATARYASPRVVATPTPALTFAAGATSGNERRRVRYDLVALTDLPDEIRGAQVGQLQANDEVEVLKRQGVWLNVRTPVGNEGWIHRTTLQPIEDAPDALDAPTPAPAAAAAPTAFTTPGPSMPGIAESIDAEVAMGAFAAATAAAARAHALEAATAPAAVSEAPKAAPKRTRTRGPATPGAPATPPVKPAAMSNPRSASRRAPSA